MEMPQNNLSVFKLTYRRFIFVDNKDGFICEV
jgi:hypothetical protein